ncbi:I78 family peptidase inhibitor [Paracoccus pacificus]|uniref:I78 family peptidase inhibitor n=1 Tax=Paracoccus pacificus TaxID=1463598 RepID=A0ABW4RD96_9RHOB
MTKFTVPAALAAVVALSACEPTAPTTTTVVTGPAATDTCNMRAAYGLLGQPSTALTTGVLPPGTLIVTFDGAGRAADYNPQRLIVELDRNGKAASLRCG